MDDSEFQQVTRNAQERKSHYQTMVPAYYDRVTDKYRRYWSDSFHFALYTDGESMQDAIEATEKQIADAGKFRPGQRVLDIGCGIGGPALTIAGYSGAHITGVNITPQHIEIARQRAAERGLEDRTHFQVADAMALPFADGAFDAAYQFEAGCYMPDKGIFCREAARALRPGGCFLGLDLFKKDGLNQEEEERYIEPICRLHGFAYLSGLREFGEHLTAAGLEVHRLEPVAHERIARNWEIVDSPFVRGIRGLLPALIPPAVRMLADGGAAMAAGARAGVFRIGYFIAHKPFQSGTRA